MSPDKFFRTALLLAVSVLAAPALRAQCDSHAQHIFGNCVILYDSALKRAYIVPRDVVETYTATPMPIVPPTPAAAPALPAGWFYETDRRAFLLDNLPIEFFVVNRKLKQTFSVNVLTVFNLQGGAVNIRGIAPSVTQLPSTPSPAPAATTPASHGAAGVGAMTVDQIFTDLLSEKNFDIPRQSLVNEAEGIRTTARELNEAFTAYTDRLNRIIGGPPAAAAAVQGTPTLLGTAAGFSQITADIPVVFADLNDPDAEHQFDLVNLRIGDRLADVQRINSILQSFPIVDALVGQPQSLEYQMEGVESSLVAYYADVHTVRIAVEMLQRLLSQNKDLGRRDYVECLSEAEVKKDIRSHYSSTNTPNFDDATITRIAEQYAAACPGNLISPWIGVLLPGRLADLHTQLDQFDAGHIPAPNGTVPDPDAALLQRGAMRARYTAAGALLGTTRADILSLNDAEASTLTAINNIYNTRRVRRPVRVDLNLNGATGNLSVNYSVTGVEQFQPYRMQGEVQQPVTASASPAPAPTAAPAAAAPAASPAASPATAPAPPAPPAPSAAPAPPPEYVGNFRVHHFTWGTFFGGFAFTSISNRSYGVGPCSANCQNIGASSITSASDVPMSPITQSIQSPGRAVVLGVNVYLRPVDMYPDLPPKLSPGILFGASVDPLNQYLLGPSVEVIRGFLISAGGVLGQQNRLPNGQYPGQLLPYSGSTAPALSSASGFRRGFYGMVAFDFNIFQTVFSKIFGGLTTLGSSGQ